LTFIRRHSSFSVEFTICSGIGISCKEIKHRSFSAEGVEDYFGIAPSATKIEKWIAAGKPLDVAERARPYFKLPSRRTSTGPII
jgi:hypothetical protein